MAQSWMSGLESKFAALENKHHTGLAKLQENYRLCEAKLLLKIDNLSERVATLESLNGNKVIIDNRDRDERPVDSSDYDMESGNKVSQAYVDIAKPRRALTAESHIAFTVYIDHDANNLGSSQIIHFNQDLLNDGNGFNKYFGIFTAPVSGVYVFSFVIGQRGDYDAIAALFVNDINKVDAVVETKTNSTDDEQGGNSAGLKTAAGDIVCVCETMEVRGTLKVQLMRDIPRSLDFSSTRWMIVPLLWDNRIIITK